MSQLVTGEAVVLDLRLAELPTRALALFVDIVLQAVVGIPVLIALGIALAGADPALIATLVLAVLVALLIGIPVAVETLSRGRSVGKLMFGLRVVRDDGGPIRFRHALARGLAGFFVDFYVTSGAGAVISSLISARGKRIGDLLAGTVVVRERTPTAGDQTAPAMPQPLAAWATQLELSALSPDLVLAARNYLARWQELAPEVRDAMGARIAAAVAGQVQPPPPSGTPPWTYLAAVLAERRRREAARVFQTPAPAPTENKTPAERPTDPPTNAPGGGFTPPR